jgi:hypothetical protein
MQGRWRWRRPKSRQMLKLGWNGDCSVWTLFIHAQHVIFGKHRRVGLVLTFVCSQRSHVHRTETSIRSHKTHFQDLCFPKHRSAPAGIYFTAPATGWESVITRQYISSHFLYIDYESRKAAMANSRFHSVSITCPLLTNVLSSSSKLSRFRDNFKKPSQTRNAYNFILLTSCRAPARAKVPCTAITVFCICLQCHSRFILPQSHVPFLGTWIFK